MSIQIGPYTFDRIRYDREADVLYLAQGDPARAVDFDETPEGHAVSFDAAGVLVGLTLVDTRHLLEEAAERGEKVTIELPAVADPAELQLAVA
jgi:uncharacterized protein YuzE